MPSTAKGTATGMEYRGGLCAGIKTHPPGAGAGAGAGEGRGVEVTRYRRRLGAGGT